MLALYQEILSVENVEGAWRKKNERLLFYKKVGLYNKVKKKTQEKEKKKKWSS